MATSSGKPFVLADSTPLRMLTLFLFYCTQGFPIGLFFYAIPAWMAINGASTGEIASVVGTASLPWSLKLVNGFLIDRYTFLAMGRRRSWIIGAQAIFVLVLLAGAIHAPAYNDIFALSAIGFAANMAITFQDVGIDSLAVDIMPESERAKAGGIMFGAQALGIAAATALGGFLLENFGFATCMAIAALFPAAVMTYGIFVRERAGERHLPWSPGAIHPANREVHVAAWLPLLKGSMTAILMPLSLVLLPILLLRAIPAGAHEAFHPVLATDVAGWMLSDYTGIMSMATLVSGLLGLVVGGWAIDAIGAQRALAILLAIGAGSMGGMMLLQEHWASSTVLTGYFVLSEILGTFVAIAVIPICMRMCSPAVAATQFTIYMAVANFGRPLGAGLAAAMVGQDQPGLMYGALAILWLVTMAVVLVVRFPSDNRAFHQAADVLPQGEGMPPARD